MSDFIPADIRLFKVNNENISIMFEISSKITIAVAERRQQRRSGVFIFSFEQIIHCSGVFIVDFEQENDEWYKSCM